MHKLRSARLLTAASWIFAIVLASFALYLAWQMNADGPSKTTDQKVSVVRAAVSAPQEADHAEQPSSLPAFAVTPDAGAIERRLVPDTTIPERSSLEVQTYTVSQGDSVFEIANHFKIKPETVLWANYEQLNDNPDLLSLGMDLNIPPVDGVYYQWQAGDTIEAVAGKFEVTSEAILGWSGNHLDLVDAVVAPGEWIMIPGGKREFRQWLIPTIPRGRAGVSSSLYGAGTCEGGYEGAYGSGSFIWPAGNHSLSGNDYWDGHLAIDIAAGEGAQIYAADSGVVVFAGWANGGYGNMVMVDHGNGYQTLYGHMSKVTASCGQSVSQGGIIGYAGSTGNSTGPHLHFEVRFQGGFINPWYILP